MNRSYHEDYIAIRFPATLKYRVTPSTNENLSVATFGHDALMFGSATQMSDPQGSIHPPVSAEVGYTKPPYQTAEYDANGQTLASGQPSCALNGDGKRGFQVSIEFQKVDIMSPENDLYESQLPGVDLSRPEFETIHVPVIQIPGRLQLQRKFLLFLTKNLPLLNSVTDSTPDGMARVLLAFEEHIHLSGVFPPFADINKIFQQFKPIVGSPAIRQESDARKTKTVKRECPFQFCAGNFTRAAGLKSHLSAHFRLAPNMCPRCGKRYSDVAFRRHVDNCRKASSSHLNNQSLQM